MRKTISLFTIAVTNILFGFVSHASAQASPSARMLGSVGGVAKASGQKAPTGQDLPVLIGGFLNVFISLLGTVMMFYLLYGGYLWMTAQGDEKQVDKARSVIKNAIIGMVVVSLSFAISAFVLNALDTSQVSQGLQGPPPVTP